MPAAHNADVLNGLSADRKKFLGGNEFTVGNSTAAPEKQETPAAPAAQSEPAKEEAPAVKAPAAAPKTTAAKTAAKA
jgi:hypothetical protein